ncbi:MAG: P1 family peptidase [Candidatus Dormiibacterota bacterium]
MTSVGSDMPSGPGPQRPRLRDHSIEIGRLKPGPLNAISDVDGVTVGHMTVWSGMQHPIVTDRLARTGVTVVVPHQGNLFRARLFAGSHALSGYGELTSRSVISEWGLLGSPIALTNSHSVGVVHDALVRYLSSKDAGIGVDDVLLPVVAECDDSYLNDIRGMHVTREHVIQALESARGGPVMEGTVGAGTGMQCFGWKGGIGTSSRLVRFGRNDWTVGCLVLTNYGDPRDLMIGGYPIGRQLVPPSPRARGRGSCIVVVATSAPIDSRQCERLAQRACLGLVRTGSIGADGSGEFAIAFSTACKVPRETPTGILTHGALVSGSLTPGDSGLDLLFLAAIEATEEAALNALFTATTVSGRSGNTLLALPLEPTLGAIRRDYRSAP